jgi:hypothetical protein
VGATAVVSCTWALLHPLSFSGIDRELASSEIRQLECNILFLFTILATLTTWMIAALVMGMHLVRPNRGVIAHYLPVAAFIVSGLASAALLLLGTINVYAGQGRQYWIWIVLGIVGLADARKGLSWSKLEPCTPAAILVHLECMIGAGIALYTAFFVFGANRILSLQLAGPAVFIPWLLPASIGIPATVLARRHYRRTLVRSSPVPSEGEVPY